MTPTAQYAKDAKHDNSRIIFGTDGNPTGWTDTAGKAHALPVDFQRVSAATCEQYRAYWLKDDPVPTDETTMDHVEMSELIYSHPGNPYLTPEQARQFYRDQNARDDAADLADEDRRDFWRQAALITLAAVIGAAGYAATMAIVEAVVK